MSGMVSKPGEVSGRARLSGGIYNISEEVPDRSIVSTHIDLTQANHVVFFGSSEANVSISVYVLLSLIIVTTTKAY